jgi:hypothetical protein
MTLSDKSLNSLVPIFDYSASNSPYDAKALVGLPTLQSFNKTLTRARLQPYGKELRNLIYPNLQSARYRAYGVWEQSYTVQDRFETAQGTTLEFLYEFKGPYKVNNAKPGTVYAKMTVILGQFPEGNTRRDFRFVDTYCWIPPLGTTDSTCIG